MVPTVVIKLASRSRDGGIGDRGSRRGGIGEERFEGGFKGMCFDLY
jgi:hypothetical protein